MIKMVWEPFEELRRLHEEMDRIFGSMVGRRRLIPFGEKKDIERYEDFRMPVTDVKETESSILAYFELPGADKKDIDVNVTDKAVEVKVERKGEKELKEKGLYRYEAFSSKYYKAIPLPAEVQSDKAQAVYKDGILKLEIPKLKKIEEKKKKIEIK